MNPPTAPARSTAPAPPVVPVHRQAVPVHPQACPGQADAVRWVTPPGALPPPAQGLAVPSALASLLDDGTLADVRIEPGGVLTRLGPGRSWPADGPRVRTAVHAALDETARQLDVHHDRESCPPDDARLRAAAAELIEGAAGEFARSHGGSLRLVDVLDGIVRVRLGGACDGCPAARQTMHLRLEGELRRRCPDLRAVEAVAPPGALGGWADRARRLTRRPVPTRPGP